MAPYASTTLSNSVEFTGFLSFPGEDGQEDPDLWSQTVLDGSFYYPADKKWSLESSLLQVVQSTEVNRFSILDQNFTAASQL